MSLLFQCDKIIHKSSVLIKQKTKFLPLQFEVQFWKSIDKYLIWSSKIIAEWNLFHSLVISYFLLSRSTRSCIASYTFTIRKLAELHYSSNLFCSYMWKHLGRVKVRKPDAKWLWWWWWMVISSCVKLKVKEKKWFDMFVHFENRSYLIELSWAEENLFPGESTVAKHKFIV